MLHRDELAAIAAWCDRNGVRLISDEIYHGLNYDSPIASAAEFSGSAIVVNSFSKYFSMTGWRVGWLVLPPDLVRPVECLAQNMFISAPYISQVAAEAAFDCHEELQANIARYRRSRDHLLAMLPAARVSTAVAGGGGVLSVRRCQRPVERQRGASAPACCRRPGSRSAPAWISTVPAATGSFGSAIADRRRICRRRRTGWRGGGDKIVLPPPVVNSRYFAGKTPIRSPRNVLTQILLPT